MKPVGARIGQWMVDPDASSRTVIDETMIAGELDMADYTMTQDLYDKACMWVAAGN